MNFSAAANNNDLSDTIARCLQQDAPGTAAQLYIANMRAQKNNIETGLTCQSLTITKDSKQSHAAASNGIIVSAAAASTGAVLSPIGKLVVAHRHFDQAVDMVKWDIAKANVVGDVAERAAAKAKVELDTGLTKLPKGVDCDGCGNNKTRNQDKWNKHYCQRSKACKALAATFYATKLGDAAAVVDAPAPAAVAPSMPIEAQADLVAQVARLKSMLKQQSDMDDDEDLFDDEEEPEEEPVKKSKKDKKKRAQK